LKRIITYRFAGTDVHIPKLIGAFVLVAALLMFIGASAKMFDSWDQVTNWQDCAVEANIIDDASKYNDCRLALYYNTGVYPDYGDAKLSMRQLGSIIMTPVAEIFFWLAVLFLGSILYRTGRLELPIEETIVEIKEKQKGRK